MLELLWALLSGGAVEGTVFFDGTPPRMEELKRSSDPFCARTRAWDESVVLHDGRLANVVVRIVGAPPAPPPPHPVIIEQRNCGYLPHVSAMVLGQRVEIVNRDPTLHNLHAYVGTTSYP